MKVSIKTCTEASISVRVIRYNPNAYINEREKIPAISPNRRIRGGPIGGGDLPSCKTMEEPNNKIENKSRRSIKDFNLSLISLSVNCNACFITKRSGLLPGMLKINPHVKAIFILLYGPTLWLQDSAVSNVRADSCEPCFFDLYLHSIEVRFWRPIQVVYCVYWTDTQTSENILLEDYEK